MSLWLVKASWIEDETEANEQWEVNAATAHDAIREATKHIRFHPHHVEAKLCSTKEEARGGELRADQVRRIPPQ
jgi:hypothetical protein